MTALLIVIVLHITPQGVSYEALMQAVPSMEICTAYKEKTEGKHGADYVIPICAPISRKESVAI